MTVLDRSAVRQIWERYHAYILERVQEEDLLVDPFAAQSAALLMTAHHYEPVASEAELGQPRYPERRADLLSLVDKGALHFSQQSQENFRPIGVVSVNDLVHWIQTDGRFLFQNLSWLPGHKD